MTVMGHDGAMHLPPAFGVGAYQTFSISQPADVLIKAACVDVDCPAYRHGWQTTCDESTDLGKRQADYIRNHSGRTFKEQHTEGLTVFVFEAFQRCFANHATRGGRFLVRDGDWRGNPTGRIFEHENGADWVEDFGEHQQRIADQQERG
jgi:hypothetical protein